MSGRLDNVTSVYDGFIFVVNNGDCVANTFICIQSECLCIGFLSYFKLQILYF